MRKFSWILLVLLAFSVCAEDEKEVRGGSVKGKKKPFLAASLSSGICIPVAGIFLPPGMGQIYNGEHKKGTVFNLVRYVSLASGFISNPLDDTYLPEIGSDQFWQGVFIASVVSFAGSVIWPPIDAYRSAKRINAEIDQKLQEQEISNLLKPIKLKHLPHRGTSLSYDWHF